MARMLTIKGLRSISPAVALPRETTAAAKAITTVEAATDKLVAATKPEQVREILTESFAQAMLDLAIKRDPHVSMWGLANWQATEEEIVPVQADLFGGTTAGAANSPVPAIQNNLITANKPLKPCLIHNVASYVIIDGGPENINVAVGAFALHLVRHKEIIFEVPLIATCCGIVGTYYAGDPVARPIIDIEPIASGGLELEGHGAPYLSSDEISLMLVPISGAKFTDTLRYVSIICRVDGETLEM